MVNKLIELSTLKVNKITLAGYTTILIITHALSHTYNWSVYRQLYLNTLGAVTISQGKEFQSFIIRCEKINCLIVLLLNFLNIFNPFVLVIQLELIVKNSLYPLLQGHSKFYKPY